MENQTNQNQQPQQGAMPSNQDAQTPQTPKRKSKLGMIIALVIILFLLFISGSAGYAIFKNLQTNNQQVACTLEAMICPDGSSVGRTGPNCEFSPCPTVAPDPTADWETYENTDYNFSFKYPSSFNLIRGEKTEFTSKNFDNQPLTVQRYALEFTNGEMVQYDKEYPPEKDRSYLGIVVVPTNGKTIMQEYNNRETNFGTTNVTLLETTGNADEVAEVSNIANLLRLYRKNNYFISFTSSQDGPGEIDKYRDQILSTFKFTDQTPTPTCIPRPACLDATPRCLMPEPANGWCP